MLGGIYRGRLHGGRRCAGSRDGYPGVSRLRLLRIAPDNKKSAPQAPSGGLGTGSAVDGGSSHVARSASVSAGHLASASARDSRPKARAPARVDAGIRWACFLAWGACAAWAALRPPARSARELPWLAAIVPQRCPWPTAWAAACGHGAARRRDTGRRSGLTAWRWQWRSPSRSWGTRRRNAPAPASPTASGRNLPPPAERPDARGALRRRTASGAASRFSARQLLLVWSRAKG